MTPETRLLGALVRAGDRKTHRRVLGELKRNGGNMERTAAALGVAVRTLYAWRDEVPALGRQIAEHARGRGRPRGED